MSPISLCNFFPKIISKIINSRISLLLNDIISPEQSGFIQGRLIQENIAFAHEMCSDLDKNCKDGNLMIKVDLSGGNNTLLPLNNLSSQALPQQQPTTTGGGGGGRGQPSSSHNPAPAPPPPPPRPPPATVTTSAASHHILPPPLASTFPFLPLLPSPASASPTSSVASSATSPHQIRLFFTPTARSGPRPPLSGSRPPSPLLLSPPPSHLLPSPPSLGLTATPPKAYGLPQPLTCRPSPPPSAPPCASVSQVRRGR